MWSFLQDRWRSSKDRVSIENLWNQINKRVQRQKTLLPVSLPGGDLALEPFARYSILGFGIVRSICSIESIDGNAE